MVFFSIWLYFTALKNVFVVVPPRCRSKPSLKLLWFAKVSVSVPQPLYRRVVLDSNPFRTGVLPNLQLGNPQVLCLVTHMTSSFLFCVRFSYETTGQKCLIRHILFLPQTLPGLPPFLPLYPQASDVCLFLEIKNIRESNKEENEVTSLCQNWIVFLKRLINIGKSNWEK